MCTAVTLTHHTHAAETRLPLITAAATQRRSVVLATATINMAKSRTKVGIFFWQKSNLFLCLQSIKFLV